MVGFYKSPYQSHNLIFLAAKTIFIVMTFPALCSGFLLWFSSITAALKTQTNDPHAAAINSNSPENQVLRAGNLFMKTNVKQYVQYIQYVYTQPC